MRLGTLSFLLMLTACGGASNANFVADSANATAGDSVRVRLFVTTLQGGVKVGAKVTFSVNAPAELSVSSAETNAQGVAETKVTLNQAGTATVTATVDGQDFTTSVVFKAVETVPTPAAVQFVNQPANVAGLYPNKFLRDASLQPIQVSVVSSSGALVSDSNATVTIGVTGCTATLHQNSLKSIAAVSGTATFSGLAFATVGTGCKLTASSGALTGAESGTFDVTQ